MPKRNFRQIPTELILYVIFEDGKILSAMSYEIPSDKSLFKFCKKIVIHIGWYLILILLALFWYFS